MPDLQTRLRLRKVVTAAAQPTTESPTSAVVGRSWSRPGQGVDDPRFIRTLGDWQSWLARYSQELGIVRFSAGITADTAARVQWVVQKRGPTGDWDEAPDMNGMLEEYANELQDAGDLTRLQAWHYEITGEMFEVITDNGAGGADWWIYAKHAVSFPDAHVALVKDIPNGQERDRTAKRLPRNQVTRLWIPDEMFIGMATSPMRASVGDLKRYSALARYVQRTIDSRMVMNGGVWTPSEAHVEKGPDGKTSKLDWDFAQMAKRAFQDDDSEAAIIPFPFHYASEGGKNPPPAVVEFGRGLDAAAMEHRKEAREDYARGINLPSSIASEGGPGGGNHWSEWLVDEKFFSITIAPICDRIAQDRTKTFLWRKLVAEHGLSMEAAQQYRVFYDPAPVIVRPDRSDKAIELLKLGAINFATAREHCDFDEDAAMSDEQEREWLLTVIGKGQPGGNTFNLGPNGLPAGPENVTKAPPLDVAAPEPKAVAAAAAPESRVAKSNRVLKRLNAVRSELGKQLLAAGEQALEEALRQAGAKVRTRANRTVSRQGRGASPVPEPVRAAVAAALNEHGVPIAALRPHLAAVGVSEDELLRNRFSSYEQVAQRKIDAAAAKQRAILRDEGIDDTAPLEDSGTSVAAAGFLAGALGALARQRLLDGPGVQAPGEVTGAVPAKLVRDAVRVAEGLATPIAGDRPEDMPTLRESSVFDIDRDFATGLGAKVQYRWEHGFYGEPTSSFEPHEDMAASDFVTDDPEGDPDLPDGPEWTETEKLQPGDHPGCSCEWVPELIDA